MEKNGFTLIEMIVTIALLAFVGIVVSVNMIKMINNQEKREFEDFKTLVEEAACTYSTLSTVDCDSGCSIEGETLVLEGLIDEDINGFYPKNYNVNVTITDGLKECKIEEGD